ncbi:MAG: tetratricopeptide repeat protein [Patescibacteria group bacterium]|jgi:tetratricopeptide (TPR) repeat protein
MILDITALVLVVVSSVVLLVIIFKKFSILATIDVDTVPQERLDQKKDDIIEMRLRRKFEWLRDKIMIVVRPLIKIIGSFFRFIYRKALELEKNYQEKSQSKSDKSATNQQKVLVLMSEGEKLIKEEEYAQAEKKFIQVISMDHMNISAYDNLGKTYTGQKDYEHAIEALQHALKLDEKNSLTHHDLGMVYKEIGDLEKAKMYVKKAVKLDPNNPKYLDYLIEISILSKDKYTAQETFRTLKRVNPENQKLAEMEKQISEMHI